MAAPDQSGAERARLASGRDWRRWGPYVSERAWGTVREDYSADGDAWSYLSHDDARSRAYRWNEEGLGGVCDDSQLLCLAFAFWNGRDPILKERAFGLTGPQGNHGEDVKEYWYYLDSTPTHSWMRWRYFYPQARYPYEELVQVSAGLGRDRPEYELFDTGALDGGRYWEITADYAKADPSDICIRLTVVNVGPDEASLDVLPTLWFRDTWSWNPATARPGLRFDDGRVVAEHPTLGTMVLAGDGAPEPLVCENETNRRRLWGVAGGTPYPKDGINDHVVDAADTVNPALTGTKGALRYRLTVAPGASAEIRLRLAPSPGDLASGWEEAMASRRAEADAFYLELLGSAPTPDEAGVARQALAGMLWSKQFYHYDVERWLDGDPGQPTPPASRSDVRNAGWRHLNNHDVISMPDKWEYPWYAAWDLAFHCVPLAHLDPEFAKAQLVLLGREWFMHPNGQLPAYEWSFSDVNPPVHAWAALRVFEIDGRRDFDFLERVLHKLVLNFTWWVNRKDSEGSNVFEGGFLGMDNIGPIDRSAGLPAGSRLEQSDGTAWMAMYCLSLLEMSLTLAAQDPTYEDIATKFFEHFTYIASAMNARGLWDEDDAFYYDVLHLADGTRVPLRVRSLVGVVALCAVTVLEREVFDRLPGFAGRMRWFVENKPQFAQVVSHVHDPGEEHDLLLSILSPDRLRRVLATLLSEQEFLSPHGLRSLSAWHRDHPFRLDVAGVSGQVDYEPGESRTGLFGGNSNWRGPVWFPLNYLVIEALRRFHRYLGPSFTVEVPTGSGRELSLEEVAGELSGRLVGIFLDSGGRRPVFGDRGVLQTDPRWHGLIPFHEYFHGDDGSGLGASHQTGWTGLVADLVIDRRPGGGTMDGRR